jgi:hypothetical protein
VVREKVDPVTNLVGPVDDDDAPLVHYSRVDYGSERRSAGVIRMGEF